MGDYLPRSDAELVAWFERFSLKFAAYENTFGMVRENRAMQLHDDFHWLKFCTQQVLRFTDELRQRVEFRDLMKEGPIGSPTAPLPDLRSNGGPPQGPAPLPGIIPRLRAVVQRVKAHPAYTPTIGVDLGLEPETVVLPTKPIGIAEAQTCGRVTLRFTKSGHEAVLVESRRNDDPAWLPLGTFTRSPARDLRAPLTAGVPEWREYRLRFVDSNELVGDYSDVVRVTTYP